MSFEFVKELSEAKLFRNPTKLADTSIGEVADSFFNAILGISILKNTDPKAAQKYAQQTLTYSNLGDWRSSGSDLHNMAHILANPRRYDEKIAIDRVISLPEMQYKQYLRNIASGKADANFDRTFLLNLQRNLGINSSGLRSARRLIGDWDTALPNERQLAATRVFYGMQHDLQNSDLYNPISRSIKNNKLLTPDAQVPTAVKKGLPLWSKMAIAGVGGYALGRWMGSV